MSASYSFGLSRPGRYLSHRLSPRRSQRSRGSGEGFPNLLRTPSATLHLYRKNSIRPGREMGRGTFLADKPETPWESALALRKMLGNVALPEATPQQKR
ncbi:MAG: hypothetical protein ACREIH_02130 [Nitrospiraceae bacterium]